MLVSHSTNKAFVSSQEEDLDEDEGLCYDPTKIKPAVFGGHTLKKAFVLRDDDWNNNIYDQ